jgi:hypothetical protein
MLIGTRRSKCRMPYFRHMLMGSFLISGLRGETKHGLDAKSCLLPMLGLALISTQRATYCVSKVNPRLAHRCDVETITMYGCRENLAWR